MELKKRHLIDIIVMPIIIGLLVNYIYGIFTEKNHSNANKSGSDIEINIEINID